MVRYPIYKGLQKPLIYRGFRGKFIAWGIGSLVIGLISGGIISALSNMYLGGLFTILNASAGLFYTFHKQKGGLYSRTLHRGVMIHPIPFQKSYAT
ncbi:DUF4133 domain-containing protein [Pedobacter chinensis]|uniref:DUF4133 domain-containing protein n=1 Tax=Pedobacter chinensis TaxID=2282421 RepID=A0A369PUD5_9SPHI|nr:DUF4133 domain-containing protein [Pedobacter chinensis]RDC54329.1 DUF4133 domain-containing protein [Pedobacter chinensis]